MSFELPIATIWDRRDEEHKERLLEELDRLLVRGNGAMSTTAALVLETLTEVCNPLLTPDSTRGQFWRPYRDGEKNLSSFFGEWLKYDPAPDNPGLYIEYWDHLTNTRSGPRLANDDERFKKWFVRFLDLRGRWLNSTSSTSTLQAWMKYRGTPTHPFNIDDYDVPKEGFRSFNQFFLRNVKDGLRPLCAHASDPHVVVAPCDGGVFYLTHGELTGNAYQLPGKSHDVFQLEQALPGYGGAFLGGPLLDILLWFTDYHHFCAPVSGKVIHLGQYQGSYNYDFDNFDAEDPYAPVLRATSDRVGWYERLGKHKRFVWIIKTEKLGLVAMVAIGFWGVGSIVSAVSEGDVVQKGQYMGHFGYGGSSIVLGFEPNLNLQFAVGSAAVSDPDSPLLMQVKQCLGKRTDRLRWQPGGHAT